MFKRGSKPILWPFQSKEEELSSTRAAAMTLSWLRGYVWLCMAMYGYVWLCMAVYDYVGLFMAM